jgi:ParB-like chromosome segregation protein Spo0J
MSTATPFQLFPALDAATEAALRGSIERFGVLVPVVRDQHGRTLDGYHRSRLADEVGVKYRVDVVHVADDDEARELARTLNADRRHLTAEQRRAMVKFHHERGDSVRATAGAIGVPKSTVADDLAQLSGAGQLSSPEKTRGLDGRLRRACRTTVVAAKDEKEARRAQAALGRIDDLPASHVIDVKRAERIAREQDAERVRQAGTAAATKAGDVEIRHGDFREILTDLDGKVDAIVTDPPYGSAHIGLYRDLGVLAARALTVTGVLVVMTGQANWFEQEAELLHWRSAGSAATSHRGPVRASTPRALRAAGNPC